MNSARVRPMLVSKKRDVNFFGGDFRALLALGFLTTGLMIANWPAQSQIFAAQAGGQAQATSGERQQGAQQGAQPQQSAQAQQGAQAGQAQSAAGQKSAASTSTQVDERQFRPRLPNYYAQVVTEEQRQKIYDIQRKYFTKIETLRRQLEALIAERDKEIEAVLTPEQRSRVEQLRREAAERRGARRAEAAATQSDE